MFGIKKEGINYGARETVVCIIYDNKQRILTGKHPSLNFPIFPGGGIKPGSDIMNTAIEESLEEAGALLKKGTIKRALNSYKIILSNSKFDNEHMKFYSELEIFLVTAELQGFGIRKPEHKFEEEAYSKLYFFKIDELIKIFKYNGHQVHRHQVLRGSLSKYIEVLENLKVKLRMS